MGEGRADIVLQCHHPTSRQGGKGAVPETSAAWLRADARWAHPWAGSAAPVPSQTSLGNKGTESAGHLFVPSTTFLHCYFIKISITFMLHSYQDLSDMELHCQGNHQRQKQNSQRVQCREHQAFFFPTPGLEVFSKSNLKHEQLKT